MNFIENFNEYLENLKYNKRNLLFTISFISIIIFIYIDKSSESLYNLFDNSIFKIILFCILTYICNQNNIIGIILVILVLTILQINTSNKLMSHEDYKIVNNL